MKSIVTSTALVVALSSAALQPLYATEPNTLTESERRAGWQLLFDGESTENWRNYKQDTISDGWVVEDGALTRAKKGAGDIISREQYEYFELSIEYRISPEGNSGIMFHVTETEPRPWQTGPEIQVQDNVDGHDPQKAGWLYQLYKPGNDPTTGEPVDATRPVGEWNQVYLRIAADQCEIDMNGVRYARFRLGSKDWKERVAKSKFAKYENFGSTGRGHICLQDHNDVVSYRNIKVRRLSEDGSVPEPIDGTLPLTVKPAFPNLQWADWEPVDDRGRPQPFRPVIITNADDGSNRLFVAEQHGTIYSFVADEATTESHVFLDINDDVKYSDRQNEEGLLGLAFHPDFKENGHFFVYYTTTEEPQTSIISRFTASKDDPNQADPESEVELMRIKQPFWNHNGGTLTFGPDGYLYIGLGDGGAANDPYNNAQNLQELLGSILRIDVDSKTGDKPYGIPADNPFVGRDDARPEIWAYGLRNVWRMSFDRKTGTMWIADVGQNLWEEINIGVAGGNYGWNLQEGLHPFGAESPSANDDLIAPIWEYDHQVGKSITGGYVYRGSKLPMLEGKYVYVDYVSGKIWALDYDMEKQQVVSNEAIPTEKMPVITFGEDESGEIYFGVVSPTGKGLYTFAAE